LERDEHRGEGLDEVACFVEKPVAGHTSERLDHARRARRGRGALFGVESKRVDAATRHRPADFELHERLDEQGEEVTSHEPFDAGGVLQEHRSDELVALEEVTASFEMRLVLVGDEHLAHFDVAHVGHKRPAAIRGGVVDDEVLAHRKAQVVADPFDAPVAGVLPRTPARLLAVGIAAGGELPGS
jgi:hypothetical protein